MQTVLIVVLVLIAAFFGFILTINMLVRVRAKAMKGKPLPELPGAVGARIRKAEKGLVYFFSPACGACRSVTPKVRALREKNQNVFLVDISEDLGIARALSILATPSIIEVDHGTISAVHVGIPPQEVLLRHG